MIVVITSWAPVRALRRPAMPPQTAPPRKPAITASGRCTALGRSQVKPTHPAHVAPITSWPAPPMLKSPARDPRRPPRLRRLTGRPGPQRRSRSCARPLLLGGNLPLGRLLDGARHQQPDALPAGVLTVDDADDPAPVDHGDAVGQRQHLVELRGVEQHADALVALGDHLAVDVLDRPHVEAPGRL